jgi:hypothetical protein
MPAAKVQYQKRQICIDFRSIDYSGSLTRVRLLGVDIGLKLFWFAWLLCFVELYGIVDVA